MLSIAPSSTAASGRPRSPDVVRRGPVLVATDGSIAADAALVVGSALAARLGAPVRVVSVVDALLPPAADGRDREPSAADQGRRADRLRSVREQIRKAIGGRVPWDVEVYAGPPARTIAHIADDCDARLLVVGLGHHRLRDRIPGRETALQLVRLAHVPVLAVPTRLSDLPTRAVIATDFSPFSERAARVALDVLEDDAMMFLAHAVARFGTVIPGWEPSGPDLDVALEDAFARFRGRIGADYESVIENVTLHGSPGDAVLEFAQATGADLIVTGTHGFGFFERLIVGSVATTVVRGAHCMVLVVPPTAHDARHEEPPRAS